LVKRQENDYGQIVRVVELPSLIARNFKSGLYSLDVSHILASAVRDILADNVVEFDEKESGDRDADSFNYLQPGIPKCKAKTLWT